MDSRLLASETTAMAESTSRTIDLTSHNAGNINVTSSLKTEFSQSVDIMMALSIAIASVGIISNFVVVIVFLNHRKIRRKIPNMFIINQVSKFKFI